MELGVEKVELDDLLRRSDFITLHTPLTDKTRNIIDAAALTKTKKGVRIINCARGGLVDERALAAALKSGHVGGAAFDVFEVEPAKESVLFGLPNVICTPHLGASTGEAQENVALQVAEQMSDYLLKGAISNAVNFPEHHGRGSAAAARRGSSSPSSWAPSPASSPKPASRASASSTRAKWRRSTPSR